MYAFSTADTLQRVKRDHKVNMIKRFEYVCEGNINPGHQTPLNKIFTSLYITEGQCEEVNEPEEFGACVDVHDPWADPEEAQREYGIRLLAEVPDDTYDAIVLTVAHREFGARDPDRIRRYGKPGCVIYDVKRVLPRDFADGRL